MNLSVIILAAGQGTRMKSALPKVLHPLAGKPLLLHVVAAAHSVSHEAPHIVYGHGGHMLQERLAFLPAEWVEQAEQLGTGHAVSQAMAHIPDDHHVLVLYGDVPLISTATLQRLCAAADDSGFALLTAEFEDPTGYGRIVRDNGKVQRIVEQKDAGAEERAICEINTGMMTIRADYLHKWLAQLDNDNVQGEYYLTDIIAMAVADGIEVMTVSPANQMEVMGVNDRQQLSVLERYYQTMNADEYMKQGLTLQDPARFDVRGELQFGSDVSIDINVIIEGEVTLGNNVTVGPNVLLRNCQVGDNTEILANCVIEDAVIGNNARIGPFARVRPETRIHDNAHVGNFVEIKKSEIGEGSKVNHLSYVGDSEIGSHVNVGAGTITCNYDGANKHKTTIEDNAFIGSGSQLVAPVKVGKNATLGAGTTLTSDAPDGELTISRAPQKTVKGWKRPVKKQ